MRLSNSNITAARLCCVAVLHVTLAGCMEKTPVSSSAPDPKANESAQVSQPDGNLKSPGPKPTTPVQETPVQEFDLGQWPSPPTDSGQLRDSAAQLAEKIVAQLPREPDAWEVKARFCLLLGETDTARMAWQQALEINPEYPYALHGMGKVGLLNSDYPAAIEALNQARTLLPDLAEISHDLARAYTKAGQVSEAAGVLSNYVDEHSDATETLVLLGNAYLTLREFGKAREAFEKALEQYPELPRAQQGLGTALVRLGERERGRKLLSAQREARVFESKNRPADQVFRDQCTDTAIRYAFAARVFSTAGDFSNAVSTLMQATTIDPQNQDAWALLIDLLSINRLWAASVEVAQRMVNQNPGNSNFWFSLGGLQVRGGEIESARKSFARVIELSPKAAEGYEALVRINVQTRFAKEETTALAEKLTRLRGSSSDFELLAQVYAIADRYDEAKDSLEKAIELSPENEAYKMALQQLTAFLDSR